MLCLVSGKGDLMPIASKDDIDELFWRLRALSQDERQILQVLKDRHAASTAELSAHLLTLPATVKQAVHHLEEFGLCTVTSVPEIPTPTEKVELTPEGEDAATFLPLAMKVQ